MQEQPTRDDPVPDRVRPEACPHDRFLQGGHRGGQCSGLQNETRSLASSGANPAPPPVIMPLSVIRLFSRGADIDLTIEHDGQQPADVLFRQLPNFWAPEAFRLKLTAGRPFSSRVTPALLSSRPVTPATLLTMQ